MADRARRAVLDALNGGADSVDPAVKRGLISLASTMDESFEQHVIDHVELMTTIEERLDRIEAKQNRLATLAITSVTTFVLTLIGTLVSIVFN